MQTRSKYEEKNPKQSSSLALHYFTKPLKTQPFLLLWCLCLSLSSLNELQSTDGNALPIKDVASTSQLESGVCDCWAQTLVPKMEKVCICVHSPQFLFCFYLFFQILMKSKIILSVWYPHPGPFVFEVFTFFLCQWGSVQVLQIPPTVLHHCWFND